MKVDIKLDDNVTCNDMSKFHTRVILPSERYIPVFMICEYLFFLIYECLCEWTKNRNLLKLVIRWFLFIYLESASTGFWIMYADSWFFGYVDADFFWIGLGFYCQKVFFISCYNLPRYRSDWYSNIKFVNFSYVSSYLHEWAMIIKSIGC